MNSAASIQPEIFIRADGNAAVGFGHLMRALAFAVHAKQITSVTLIIRDPDLIARNSCRLYEVPLIDISHVKEEEEAAYVGNLSGSKNIIFLDGYQFSENYQRIVKQSGSFLVCMDDHHDRYFLADCVINVSEIIHPERVKRSPATRLVFGLRFALIRPEFSINENVSRDQNRVFICFGGGAETLPLIEKALQALLLSNIEIHQVEVVINENLISRVSEVQHVQFPQLSVNFRSNLSATEIADLMRNSTFGICSSSTVSLEARALNLPIVAGYFVENQKGIYHSLLVNNEIPELGDLNKISSEHLCEKLIQLNKNLKSKESVLNPSSIGRNYNRLIHSWLIEMQFALRKAAETDVELYFNWANNKEVRQNALNSDPIIFENHHRWFSSRLTSDVAKLYVAEWKGIPIGQIRFELHNNLWEIDYSVDPQYRNMGMGELLIRKGMCELLTEVQEDITLVGLVKNQNKPSAEVFKKMHFHEGEQEIRGGVELRRFTYSLTYKLLSL